MTTFFDDVGAFNRKFGLPATYLDRPCAFPTEDEIAYRLKFMDEELEEFRIACLQNDLPGAVDALVDLVYVALGTAHYFGAPFNKAWIAVQIANMAKARATSEDPDHKRGTMEPLRKPEGWKPPDIEGIIDSHNGIYR
jgi:predicted HAD superfamily Cof-like phosphohydrolase